MYTSHTSQLDRRLGCKSRRWEGGGSCILLILLNWMGVLEEEWTARAGWSTPLGKNLAGDRSYDRDDDLDGDHDGLDNNDQMAFGEIKKIYY